MKFEFYLLTFNFMGVTFKYSLKSYNVNLSINYNTKRDSRKCEQKSFIFISNLCG